MKNLLILLASMAITYALVCDDEDETIIIPYEPFKQISVVDDQDEFMDDFDTTFVIYGCTYNSWKK